MWQRIGSKLLSFGHWFQDVPGGLSKVCTKISDVAGNALQHLQDKRSHSFQSSDQIKKNISDTQAIDHSNWIRIKMFFSKILTKNNESAVQKTDGNNLSIQERIKKLANKISKYLSSEQIKETEEIIKDKNITDVKKLKKDSSKIKIAQTKNIGIEILTDQTNANMNTENFYEKIDSALDEMLLNINKLEKELENDINELDKQEKKDAEDAKKQEIENFLKCHEISDGSGQGPIQDNKMRLDDLVYLKEDIENEVKKCFSETASKEDNDHSCIMALTTLEQHLDCIKDAKAWASKITALTALRQIKWQNIPLDYIKKNGESISFSGKCFCNNIDEDENINNKNEFLNMLSVDVVLYLLKSLNENENKNKNKNKNKNNNNDDDVAGKCIKCLTAPDLHSDVKKCVENLGKVIFLKMLNQAGVSYLEDPRSGDITINTWSLKKRQSVGIIVTPSLLPGSLVIDSGGVAQLNKDKDISTDAEK